MPKFHWIAYFAFLTLTVAGVFFMTGNPLAAFWSGCGATMTGVSCSLGTQRRIERDLLSVTRCKVSEETGGHFIGRRQCHTHNIVWDDSGVCPRAGQEAGQPFTFAYRLEGDRY